MSASVHLTVAVEHHEAGIDPGQRPDAVMFCDSVVAVSSTGDRYNIFTAGPDGGPVDDEEMFLAWTRLAKRLSDRLGDGWQGDLARSVSAHAVARAEAARIVQGSGS